MAKYKDYMLGDNNSYAEERYKNMYTGIKINFGIPSFVNTKKLEEIVYTRSESIYKFNKRDVNRNYPFKFYNILNIPESNLVKIINSDINNITDRLKRKIYQYNFEKENKRISVLLITSKNKLYSAYIILDNKLEPVKDIKSIIEYTDILESLDTIEESYISERREINTNKINSLASIARINGIETTNRLRDDIVSEYTNILESLDTIDESIIVKDISLLPVYKINEELLDESYIEEGFKDNEKYYYSQIIRTSKKIISSKLKDLKSCIKYDIIGSYKNKLETSNKNIVHSYVYAYIYNKDIKDKTLISKYIKNMNSELSPKGISITKSQFEHEKGGKGVEFSFKVKSRINEESLNNFFIEEETEIINESLSGDYQNIMSFNIGFLGRKVYSIKMLKRMKGSLEKKLNKYETKLKEFKKMNDDEKAKFCFKINAGNAARSAAIAAGTTAVSQYASDGNYSLTYIELPDKITPYNYPGIAEKMIRKLKSDIQNIDRLIKQKEKAKGIKEGYAIDLNSLKYVVEYKKLTLEEAIQEIKDVNYIGDTYPMYCVIPENINENMTLESFITLNEALINSNITPISSKVFTENEFIN